MKELNKFREFLAEGPSKLMSQGKYWVKNNDLGPKTTTADIEKWVSDNFEKYAKPGDDKAKIIADLTAYNDGLNKGNVSENALGVDKGDGTFEMTPDIQIMGQKFNFSDICPSAHKLVQNQAIVHQGFSRTAPIVLSFAILHRDFFALEKEALGPQGIDVDTFKNDVTRLYTEILNVAEQLGVRKQAKKYMDMHLAKIKDNGFKASDPGGSSDRNFEEQLKEAHNRWKNEVEGYTDLHENDVALEAFLGEEELEENDTPWKVTVTNEKTGEKSSFLYKDENDAIRYSRKVNDEHDGYSAVVNVMTESLKEEIEMVEPQRGHAFYKLNKDVDLELQTGSTSVTNAPGVLLHPVFGKTIIASEGQYIINFHGQLFYVDMDEKFATKVPKHEDSDNMENLRGALVPVDMAPKFNPGWKSYLNEPL